MRGCSPVHPRTAPLDAGFCGGGRENTDHVFAGSAPSPLLVGPADNTSRLESADLGPNLFISLICVCFSKLIDVCNIYKD